MDAKKFLMALRKVRVCNPTGVSKEDVLSIAVAVHVEKAISMDYEIKSYFKENWLDYKTWTVWSKYSKWAVSAAKDGVLAKLPPARGSKIVSQQNNSVNASSVQSDLEVEDCASH